MSNPNHSRIVLLIAETNGQQLQIESNADGSPLLRIRNVNNESETQVVPVRTVREILPSPTPPLSEGTTKQQIVPTPEEKSVKSGDKKAAVSKKSSEEKKPVDGKQTKKLSSSVSKSVKTFSPDQDTTVQNAIEESLKATQKKHSHDEDAKTTKKWSPSVLKSVKAFSPDQDTIQNAIEESIIATQKKHSHAISHSVDSEILIASEPEEDSEGINIQSPTYKEVMAQMDQQRERIHYLVEDLRHEEEIAKGHLPVEEGKRQVAIDIERRRLQDPVALANIPGINDQVVQNLMLYLYLFVLLSAISIVLWIGIFFWINPDKNKSLFLNNPFWILISSFLTIVSVVVVFLVDMESRDRYQLHLPIQHKGLDNLWLALGFADFFCVFQIILLFSYLSLPSKYLPLIVATLVVDMVRVVNAFFAVVFCCEVDNEIAERNQYVVQHFPNAKQNEV